VKSIRICKQNLRKWIGNSRVIVAFVIVFLFTLIYTKGLWAVSDSVGEKLSIYIFPFLTTYRYMKIIYLFPLLLLFCDAPFIDSNQQFVMLRAGRKNWGMGQMLYIICASFLYTLFMVFSSIAVNIGHIDLNTSWGKALIVAGTTNICSLLGIQYDTVRISTSIVKYYTPAQAMFFSFLFLWMICTILGLIIYDLNIIFKSNIAGLFAAGFLILLTALVDGIQQYIWFSPVSWCSLNNIDVARTTSLPGIYYVLGIYSQMIAVLLIIGFFVSKSRRFSFEIKNNIQ
jgi:hypothetical protein